MKKLLSVFFAAIMSMLMLASCSSNSEQETTKPTAAPETITQGVYLLESEETFPCKIQVRDSNKIAIQYNSNMITESGKYSFENDVLKAKIEKNGCEYVFNFKDGCLFYDAANSTPSEKFNEKSGISDGSKFYLDHRFEAR